MTRLTDAEAVPEGMRGEDLRLSYHGTTVVHGAAISLSGPRAPVTTNVMSFRRRT